jgi:endonuclease/exonuclease/phosphatase family metal-dependent hydrolase
VEAVSYTVTRADQAHSKTVDGGAEWTTVYPPSPGASNQPQPTATPTATAVPTTASVSGHVFLDAETFKLVSQSRVWDTPQVRGLSDHGPIVVDLSLTV